MPKTWTETISGIVKTLDVASMFKQNAVYNPEGAAALAKLMRIMAKNLDQKNDLQTLSRRRKIPGR